MTQYVINIGALPNDGTGDPLRTAFNETNLNFDQVFAAGPVLSNVRIANNTILTTTTNGNLILAPNGIGRIQANATVVPSVANVRDLGSVDRRWGTLYVQYANISGSVSLTNLTATGNVTVGGNLTVTGNIINVANIVTDAKTIQLANTAGTANAANGSGITVGANDNIATFLYSSAGNRWNTNIGLQVAGTANVVSLRVNQTANAWNIAGNTLSAPSGAFWTSDYVNRDEYITSAPDGYINITSLYANGNTASEIQLEHGLAQIIVDNGVENIWTFDVTGNLTLPGNTSSINYANGTPFGSTYGNSNVATYLAGSAGNIIPVGNNAQSLGNATNQWSDLWVSNSTIYMNSVPITLGAGNVLTVNGEALLSNDSNTSISTTGNITADYFIGNGSLLTGISSTGDITFDGTTISAPDDTVIRIQAKDSDSVVRSLVRLDPDNGYAEMRALSSQRNQGFATGDWATGVWTGTENNAQLAFTGATDIVNFLNTEFSGSTNQTISVNGGEPMVYNGWSGGASDVTFFVDVAPPADPTTITSIEFNYYYSSRIEIDNDDDEINIRGTGLNININSDESVDIGATNSVEIVSDTIVSLLNNSATNPIIIRTSNGNTNQTWEFGATGNLTAPGNVSAVGNITANNIGLTGNGIVSFTSGSQLTFGDTPVTNRYYVDATRTDTYTQNGSQARPFKTIAAAQSAIATAIAGGLNPQVEPIYILLLSNITENVTLDTNHVYLIGQNGQIHQPIILTGNITVNPASGTLNSNHFSITGMEIVGGTNGKAIYVTGTSPLRLSLQDVWITANGNSGAGLYQDNTGTGTYTHGGPLKVSHNGTGDVYCFDIRKGTASFDTVETSGATQVGAAGPGAILTFNNSQLDANGDVVVETYGNGTLVVTNSVIKNAAANSYGIKLNAVANVAGTVSVGQSAFNIPAGTGQAVWLDPNTTPGLSGVFAWSGASFYPSTNTTISPTVIPGPLAILVGTQISPIFYGDITSYAVAQDWDLIDNNASALSFDTTGKAGVLELVTTNSAEGVKMSGFANVVGNVTGGNIITTGTVSATGNVSGNFFIGNGSQLTGITASYGNANVADFLDSLGSNAIVTTGNITGGNLISSTTIFGNVDIVLGNIANAAGTKTRMVTDTTFSYIQTGNGTVGSTGNIVFSPYSSTTQRVVIDTASGNLTAAGNVTAQNFIGNISITGNVIGTQPNVTLVAGAYDWTFDNTGNLTLPGNTFAVNYANNTPVDVVTRFEGSWTVTAGTNNYSFTVDSSNTYQMWVEGNIANGIIAWNATATITNTNVPVIGQQFAWNYEGAGNPIVFTSIPAQIIGTAGAISNASPAVANTNVFTFGINNTSGSNQTVRYGWIKIS